MSPSLPRIARAPLGALGALALAAALLPASASAASLSFDRTCQLETQPVTATLTGFSPNVTVVLGSTNDYGGTIFEIVPTDANGNGSVTFTSPPAQLEGPGSRELPFTATDSLDPNLKATGSYRTSTGTFTISGFNKLSTARRTWQMSGFQQDRAVYAHFSFRGKVRGTYRLGVATGVCGELTTKAPAFPIRYRVKRRIPSGEWKVQLDHSKTFSRTALPRQVGTITVSRSQRT